MVAGQGDKCMLVPTEKVLLYVGVLMFWAMLFVFGLAAKGLG